EFELPPGNESDLGKDYWYALKQSFWLAYPGADLNSTCRAKNGFEYPCVKGTEKGNKNVKLLNLYFDNSSYIVVFSDKELSGLVPTLTDYACDRFPSWLKWLCPKPPSISKSIKDLTFDDLFAARYDNKETLGIGKERCDCAGAGCARALKYEFEYFGYSLDDLTPFLGSADLYEQEDFMMNQSAPNKVVVSVTNPKSIDRNALWNALSFMKRTIGVEEE
ncbi:hypothetical protein JW826_03290, partial [Candidatus Woesearchaeota archaeon]|nr:hypothetical protein [Candidatus Woesearchaeota archaeon]